MLAFQPQQSTSVHIPTCLHLFFQIAENHPAWKLSCQCDIFFSFFLSSPLPISMATNTIRTWVIPKGPPAHLCPLSFVENEMTRSERQAAVSPEGRCCQGRCKVWDIIVQAIVWVYLSLPPSFSLFSLCISFFPCLSLSLSYLQVKCKIEEKNLFLFFFFLKNAQF